jgi:hypothetical protein
MSPSEIRPAWRDRIRSVAWRDLALVGLPVVMVLLLAVGTTAQFAGPPGSVSRIIAR